MVVLELKDWTSSPIGDGRLCQAVLKNQSNLYALLLLSQNGDRGELKFPVEARDRTLGNVLAALNEHTLGYLDNAEEICKCMGFVFNGLYVGEGSDKFLCTSASGATDAIGITNSIVFMNSGRGKWSEPGALAQSLTKALTATITPIKITSG